MNKVMQKDLKRGFPHINTITQSQSFCYLFTAFFVIVSQWKVHLTLFANSYGQRSYPILFKKNCFSLLQFQTANNNWWSQNIQTYLLLTLVE